MSSEMGEMFREMREHKKKMGYKQRMHASYEFEGAKAYAEHHGFKLVMHTESHYQLIAPGRWLLNIYPGNCRLYDDRNQNERAPYIHIKAPWTLQQVVESAVEKDQINRRVTR